MNFLNRKCVKTDVHLKGKIELSSHKIFFAACSHIQEILLQSVTFFLMRATWSGISITRFDSRLTRNTLIS